MAKYFGDPCVMAIVSNVKIIKQPMLPNLIFEQSEKTHFSIALKTTPQCGVDVRRLGGFHEKSRIPWALAKGGRHLQS